MTGGEPLRCAACGEPIGDDQEAIRLSIGVGRGTGFSHLLMRDDVYLHTGADHGQADAWPWGDRPTPDRRCATPEAFTAALWLMGVHAVSGASGRYHGD